LVRPPPDHPPWKRGWRQGKNSLPFSYGRKTLDQRGAKGEGAKALIHFPHIAAGSLGRPGRPIGQKPDRGASAKGTLKRPCGAPPCVPPRNWASYCRAPPVRNTPRSRAFQHQFPPPPLAESDEDRPEAHPVSLQMALWRPEQFSPFPGAPAASNRLSRPREHRLRSRTKKLARGPRALGNPLLANLPIVERFLPAARANRKWWWVMTARKIPRIQCAKPTCPPSSSTKGPM